MEEVPPKNIIVRLPNWIGDLVMATPVLADLKTAFPKASITAMVTEKISSLLEADPSIDELFSFSRIRGAVRRIANRSIVQKLRAGNYDLGILLTHSFSSAWHFWQGNIKRRIGFRLHQRGFLLTDPILPPSNQKKQHLVTTYKALLHPLGIATSKTAPKLYLKREEVENAWEFMTRFDIKQNTTLIGINPGAAYGSAKCWLPERFKEVAKRLINENPNYVILFFGDLSHKDLINSICAPLPSRAINLAGQTDLRSLTALISICSAFLTNDSGPMHIADSLGIPLVALFGSTDPVVTGPYRQNNQVLQKKESCSPCFKRVCPIDFPCMKNLTVDTVFKAVLHILHQKETVLC